MEMDVQASGDSPSSDIEIDEEKLKEIIKKGSLQYDEWTSLISQVEKCYPDDVEHIFLVYDSFLSEFPLCYGYWRKYVQHKMRLCTVDNVVEVFERAVEAATYSVDMWLDYCSFGMLVFEDPDDVRRLFNRGLSVVGKDYLCHALWEKYMKFEHSHRQWSSLANIYLRTLRFPTKKLHRFYDSFQKLVGTLKEEMKICLDSTMYQECDGMLDNEDPPSSKDDVISHVVRDLFSSSSDLTGSKALQKYISVGQNFYEEASQLYKKIHNFEARIKSPYFQVKPLEMSQLETWHEYLDFVEMHGNFDWVVKLYERCLIPCASYPEFWIRYVDFVESKGGREIANFALERATQTFLKNVPIIHLFNARFKEQLRDAGGARAAFLQCNPELESYFVEKVIMRANMEKRLGNLLAASDIYKEALEAAAAEKKMHALPTLYIHFSRFKYMTTNDADAGRDILIDGIKRLPHCKILIEELINFAMIHGGARHLNVVDSVVANAISPASDGSKHLNAKDVEDISNLYLQFVDHFGNFDDVKKAWNRHSKLFPDFMRSHACKLPSTQTKPFRIAVKGSQESCLSLPVHPNGDTSSDHLFQLPNQDEKLPSLRNHDASVDDAANNHTSVQQLSSLETHDVQRDPAPINDLPSTEGDKSLQDKPQVVASEGLKQIPENTLEPSASSGQEISDEIEPTHYPQDMSEENNIHKMNNQKFKQDAEQPELEIHSSDNQDSVNSFGLVDTQSKRVASPQRDSSPDGSSQKSQVPQATSVVLDENLLKTEGPEGTNISNESLLDYSGNTEKQYFASSQIGTGASESAQNQFRSNSPLSPASHNQDASRGEALLQRHTTANRSGKWHQKGRYDRVRRDSKSDFRGHRHKRLNQQRHPSSQRQYPRPGTVTQMPMTQGYPPQSLSSEYPQVQVNIQTQYQNLSSDTHTSMVASQPLSVGNFQPQIFASTIQSQYPVQPVSYTQSEMSQYPKQSNDPHGQMQNNMGYNQTWQHYYYQQQHQQQNYPLQFQQQQLQLQQHYHQQLTLLQQQMQHLQQQQQQQQPQQSHQESLQLQQQQQLLQQQYQYIQQLQLQSQQQQQLLPQQPYQQQQNQPQPHVNYPQQLLQVQQQQPQLQQQLHNQLVQQPPQQPTLQQPHEQANQELPDKIPDSNVH